MKDLLNDYNYKKYYCSPELEAKLIDYEENIAKNNVSNRELKVEIVENGIVYPLEVIPWSYIKHNIKYGGVTDSYGNFIDLSSFKKCSFGKSELYTIFGQRNTDYNLNEVEHINEDVVFMCPPNGNYMHVILESMSRIWFYIENRDKHNYKLVFPSALSVYHSVIFDILEILDISKSDIICISDKPIKFNKVVIPEQSYILNGELNHKYLVFINKLKENVGISNYENVYFSRTKWSLKSNRTLCEATIEKVFEDNGFKIVYPEEISLREKISIVKGAKILVGVFGSNSLHSMFLEDDTKALILLRDDSPNVINAEFEILKRIKSAYIESFYDILPVAFNCGPFILGITKYFVDFLNDYSFIYDEKNTRIKRSELLNYFTSWAMSYSTHKDINVLPSDTLNTQKLVDNIISLPINNSPEEVEKKVVYKTNAFEEKYSIFIGMFNDKKYFKLFIFGLAITFNRKKLVSKLAWFIPVRRLRDLFRDKFK